MCTRVHYPVEAIAGAFLGTTLARATARARRAPEVVETLRGARRGSANTPISRTCISSKIQWMPDMAKEFGDPSIVTPWSA